MELQLWANASEADLSEVAQTLANREKEDIREETDCALVLSHCLWGGPPYAPEWPLTNEEALERVRQDKASAEERLQLILGTATTQ